VRCVYCINGFSFCGPGILVTANRTGNALLKRHGAYVGGYVTWMSPVVGVELQLFHDTLSTHTGSNVVKFAIAELI
jgi:hypothetical protein